MMRKCRFVVAFTAVLAAASFSGQEAFMSSFDSYSKDFPGFTAAGPWCICPDRGRQRRLRRDLDRSGASSRLPVNVHAFISIRSMTPSKSASAPIGIWTGIGFAPSRSLIMSTVRQKLAPIRSILLTKQMRGTLVLVRLPPHRLRLRLDAGHRIEYDDAAVEHAQAPLHLDGEVDVAGRIDDVDLVRLPLGRRRGRGDRDARARAPAPSSP